MIDISIVIPLYNEAESLPELYEWIKKVVTTHQYTYEVIFIDDGSKDDSWKIIEALAAKDTHVKGIKFRRNYGKSPALHVGFEAVEGEVVITMDADLQDSPEEIPALREMIVDQGYDLVSGWKEKRYDPLSKTIPTKLFNWATRKMSGIELNDFNCGLKAYRKEVVKSIEIYGEMHRYIPVIAKRAGFDRIGQKAVSHQERKYGTTKFGLERFINGFLDLLSITFIGKFGKRPMHFFGTMGTLFFLLGMGISIYLIITKYIWLHYGMTDRPLFYFALIFMVIGTQLFLAGFLGELIARTAADKNEYLIAEKKNLTEK